MKVHKIKMNRDFLEKNSEGVKDGGLTVDQKQCQQQLAGLILGQCCLWELRI